MRRGAAAPARDPGGRGRRERRAETWSRRSPFLVALAATPFLLLSPYLSQEVTAAGLAGTVALVAAVLATGRAAALRLLPADSPAASVWSLTAVVATSVLVLPAVALGHFGDLDPALFLRVVAVFALAVTGGLPTRPPVPRPAEAAAPTLPRPSWRRRAEDACLVAAAAVALLALAFAISEEFELPVHTLDDPSYHMISVATWLQFGDLRTPHLLFGDPATAYYPIAGELIVWATMTPLAASDVLARWAQLPYLLALLVATAAVCRRLGAAPRTAAVAALLLLTPRRLLPDLALSAANDVMLAFFVVAAVDAALAWRRALRASAPVNDARRPVSSLRGVSLLGGVSLLHGPSLLGPALYCGAALGLAVGTKYLGVMLATVLVPVIVLLPLGLAARGGAPMLRRHLPALVAAGAVACVVGGYTYLRNWVSLGNPLFPFPLELGPIQLPGWQQATLAFRAGLPEFAIDPLWFLLDRPEFTGVTYYVTLLPAAVVAPLAWAVWRWRRRDDPRAATANGPSVAGWPVAWVLLLPALIYLIFLCRVYDHREVRYLFAAFALAAVGFAWLLERLPEDWRPWARMLTAVAIAAGIPANHPKELYAHTVASVLITGAFSAAGLAAGWWASPRLGRHWPPPARRPGLAAAAVAACLGAVLAAAPAADRYRHHRYDGDPVLAQLQGDVTLPGDFRGVDVRVTGSNRFYELFGSRLDNRVVPAEAHSPEATHFTWGGRDLRKVLAEAEASRMRAAAATPGGSPAPPAFVPGLKSRHPDGHVPVVVYDGSEAADWIEENPTGFERLAAHGGRTLWRFRPPTQESTGNRQAVGDHPATPPAPQ